MSATIKLRTGEKASLNKTSFAPSEILFTKDTKEIFVANDEGVAEKISHVVEVATNADLADKVEGKLYFVTEDNSLYYATANGFIAISGAADLSSIGNLDNLETTVKTDLVSAINEANKAKTINIDSINESTSRVFLSPDEKSSITSAAASIGEMSDRIGANETDIIALKNKAASEGKDELVKMTSTDTEGKVLEELVDGETIKNVSGKLSAESLIGLFATVTELNALSGIESNVQAQINALTRIGNFTGTTATYADLAADYPNPIANDMAIVLADENKTGGTSIYLFVQTGSHEETIPADSEAGTEETTKTVIDGYWSFAGDFSASIRDFAANPINLDTEVTGTLSKTKYEKPDAAEVTFKDADGNIKATTVESAIKELFQYANSLRKGVVETIGYPLNENDTYSATLAKITDLKAALANAITLRGVPAYTYNTLSEMANKVAAISNITVDTDLYKTERILVEAANEKYDLVLTDSFNPADIVQTVMQYVGDNTNVTHFQDDFNNSKQESFTYDEDKVSFDGVMKVKDAYSFALTSVSDYFETQEIDFGAFTEIGGDLEVDTDGLQVTIPAVKYANAIVKASGDISLAGVDKIESIQLSANESGNGKVRIAASVDSGETYKAFVNNAWVDINIDDEVAFSENGMSKEAINALTEDELADLRGTSQNIRFAYYLERPAYADIAETDQLILKTSMTGHYEPAPTSAYTFTYDYLEKTLKFIFVTPGKYAITYQDTVKD